MDTTGFNHSGVWLRCSFRLELRAGRSAWIAALVAAWAVWWLGSESAAAVAAQAQGRGQAVGVRAPELVALQERFAEFRDALPDVSLLNVERIDAYEEHRLFVYVMGVSGWGGGRGEGPAIRRRMLLLRPSTFVIEDVVKGPAGGGGPAQWLLDSDGAAVIEGKRVRAVAEGRPLAWSVLLPEQVSVRAERRPAGGGRVEVEVRSRAAAVRLLNVLRLGQKGGQHRFADVRLSAQQGGWRLAVSAGNRRFTITLPSGDDGAGTIEVVSAAGDPVLERRLLPSGVLPHGPNGVRMLQRWDNAYRPGRQAPWDTGRPASQLKSAVESGAVRPGRAIELGCGTGTNAVYLASRGFEVTALDLAPRALALAERKARRAGVRVRWMLADVLAPPDGLGQFDFIFDRGCYHGVRRTSAKGYVDAVRRLSHPGTRLLILAGNANEERHYGPPRVKEQELRDDFSRSFHFKWLRTIRFDTRQPGAQGPLGWSVLLERKARE